MGWFNDLKDRIKGMFNRDKRLPEAEIPAFNQAQSNSSFNNRHVFTRQDGSTLEIAPVLDEMGNQTYEQVYNRSINQFQAIPKFNIMSEELKHIVHPKLLFHTVLIDIDPNLLNVPFYADYIANQMLNAKRMEKIVHQYGNYVGTIRLDQNGMPMKMIDQGIIDTLNALKNENARIVAENQRRSENQYLDSKFEEAQKITPSIKTSHAEDLSKYR